MVSHPSSFAFSEFPNAPEPVRARVFRDLSRARRNPSDWPGPGPIDLVRHDAPHASSTLEWWYVNSHLWLEDGRQICVFSAFFRQLVPGSQSTCRSYTHSVAWGLSLPDESRHESKVAVDSLAPKVGLRNLDTTLRADDERVERALREVLARDRVPGPTRMMSGAPTVAPEGLELDYSGDRFTRLDDGDYQLHLSDQRTGMQCELRLSPEKAACRYGKDGVVHGVSGEQMFYYFVPRLRASGSIRLDGQQLRVVAGSGWYDHEFGVGPEPPRETGRQTDRALVQCPGDVRTDHGETCWRWLSIQLDDNRELSTFFITRKATGEVLDNWTLLVRADGETLPFDDTHLETLETWRSTRTFVEYPIAFRVRVPRAGIDLIARATFADQEIVSVISDPGFWEGTVQVEGTVERRPASGRGWLECKGFGHNSLDAFFGSVGREVRQRLAQLLPVSPDQDAVLDHLMVKGSVGEAAASRTKQDVDGSRLCAALVAPIRAITDRGGKGWRSYAALACIDVVGGDSRRFLHWLTMPEIVHAGSLIVDDVEDESSVRRGGPACHVVYGTPTAINAGTAAYFLAEPPVDHDPLPADTKLRVYRFYFDAMRAGHAGQALDLCDAGDLARAAVDSGDIEPLERHVLSVHRLKTAVPAAMFARVGALLGGGSEQQIECVGRYFEAIGLAFQIIDDVLNVCGFQRDLKERGEDIRAGKLTLPIVKALGRFDGPNRRWLWSKLSSTCSDEDIAIVCDALAGCGALDECRESARKTVEEAWLGLDPVVEDSQVKLMFRAFGWYVLERHY